MTEGVDYVVLTQADVDLMRRITATSADEMGADEWAHWLDIEDSEFEEEDVD